MFICKENNILYCDVSAMNEVVKRRGEWKTYGLHKFPAQVRHFAIINYQLIKKFNQFCMWQLDLHGI